MLWKLFEGNCLRKYCGHFRPCLLATYIASKKYADDYKSDDDPAFHWVRVWGAPGWKRSLKKTNVFHGQKLLLKRETSVNIALKLTCGKQYQCAGVGCFDTVGLQQILKLFVFSTWVKNDAFWVERNDIVVVFFLILRVKI